jgi:hypothetical protein
VLFLDKLLVKDVCSLIRDLQSAYRVENWIHADFRRLPLQALILRIGRGESKFASLQLCAQLCQLLGVVDDRDAEKEFLPRSLTSGQTTAHLLPCRRYLLLHA